MASHSYSYHPPPILISQAHNQTMLIYLLLRLLLRPKNHLLPLLNKISLQFKKKLSSRRREGQTSVLRTPNSYCVKPPSQTSLWLPAMSSQVTQNITHVVQDCILVFLFLFLSTVHFILLNLLHCILLLYYMYWNRNVAIMLVGICCKED